MISELFYITTYNSIYIYAFPTPTQVDPQAAVNLTLNQNRKNPCKMPSDEFQMPSAYVFNTFLQPIKGNELNQDWKKAG